MARGQRGFTLIEVMVALAILAGLSILTAQAIKSAIDNKSMMSAEINRDASLADAIRVIRNDIANAFHHRDVHVTLINEAMKAQKVTPSPNPNGAPPPPPPPVDPNANQAEGTPRPTPVDVTGFVGDSQSLYFTALTNVRTIRDAQESDQVKIGYFLKSCKSRGTKGGSSQCLYRATSPYLDEEVEKAGSGTMLVENVVEFKLRYLGPEREEYVEQWKTGKNGDDISKNNFPYAVEVTLTLHNKNDPKDKPVTQTVLAPLFFPNNPPKKKTPAPGGEVPGP